MGVILGAALLIGAMTGYMALFLPMTRRWVKNPNRAVGLAGLMALPSAILTIFAVLVVANWLQTGRW